jgi:asparagine synthase (glutamine-hydrolysing)
MCGICGIAVPDRSRRSITPELVVRMRDTLTHRGPDDAGVFVGRGIGLGHRRLSIIDVAAGHQPMASDDAAVQIVYNGEVFNHPALRADLERRGRPYRTHCDTETILRLYEEFGDDTPALLRGMFAFAIWDERKRELLLVRDRLGVKPLYYAVAADGTIVFGSEIKAVLASGVVAPELNLAGLPEYLANHATFGEDTLFSGVHRLAPGHRLRWRDGRITIERYWDLHFGGGEAPLRSDRDYVAEYGERFREAVRLRLMSDVPLGAFLSGGIDSAAITAVMSQLSDEPVKTFSVAFAERDANELAYARLVAERFRTDHHEVIVSPNEFFAALPRLVWHEDEPIAHPSSVPLFFVSRLAAQHIKVTLTGEGSDETLAGYGRYRTTLANLRLGRRYEGAVGGRLRDAVRERIEGLPIHWRARHKLMRTFLALPANLHSLYFDNFSVFSRARQGSLLSSDATARLAGTDPYRQIDRYLSECDAATLLDKLLYVDTKTYLQELLMKQDQMSMAASIESRVPFLDHPLVEFTARLPQSLKLRGFTTKYVLRRAMQGILPEPILKRRKMGFPVPVGRWLRGPFRPLLDEYVLGERALARGLFDADALRLLVSRHSSGAENHDERLWSLLNLEIWQRIYLDGEPVETIGMGRLPISAAPPSARTSFLQPAP